MRQKSYRGVITPLVTPLDEHGRVCKRSVKKLITHVAPYSTALMPNLTSGEGWKLSAAQWQAMLDYAIEYSAGLPVIVGVERPTTKTVIEFAKMAKCRNVDAIVVTASFNKKQSQAKIYQHFVEVIESVGLPLFAYNEAPISGAHIDLATMAKICTLRGIVGVKEASGDAAYTAKLVARVSQPVFQGWENLASQSPGVAGYIFPLANLEPELCNAAFMAPSRHIQFELDKKCQEYQLLEAAPYRSLKKHLFLRKIIRTDRVV